MLPDIRRPQGIGKTVQVKFGGLDLRPGAADGTFLYMEGMAPDRAPILETRPYRRYIQEDQTLDVGVLGLGKALIRIEDGFVWYNNIQICTMSTQGHSKMVAFGDRVIETELRELIHTEFDYKGLCVGTANLPETADEGDAWSVVTGQSGYDGNHVYVYEDGDWIDRGRIVEPLEASVSDWPMIFRDGTYQGVSAAANTIEMNPNNFCLPGVDPSTVPKFTDHFKAGDAVTVSGCRGRPENNLTLVVREVTETELRFYENSFHNYIGRHYVGRGGLEGPCLCEVSGWYQAERGNTDPPGNPKKYFVIPSGTSLAEGDYIDYSNGSVSQLNPINYHYEPAEILCYQADGTLAATLTPTDTYNHSTYPDGPTKLTFEAVELTSMYHGELHVSLARKWPELDGVFAHNNRLWGWKGRELRCSKLGDPKNWEVFDGLATDCWSLDTQRAEPITGGISLHGYPVFYTENRRYTIYGAEPAAFQLSELDCFGVREGCGASMAVVDGTLYYVSRNGIMADAGSLPACVSEALGEISFHYAVGCGYRKEYWVSGLIANGAGSYNDGDAATFALNTGTGEWYGDEERIYLTLTAAIGTLVGVFGPYKDEDEHTTYALICMRGSWPLTTTGTEASRPASLVTNIYTMQQPNRKRVHRIQIRGRFTGNVSINQGVSTDQRLTVRISYDGGNLITVATIEGNGDRKSFYLPILPRRCDHFQLFFSGTGNWAIESLALEYRNGSAIF